MDPLLHAMNVVKDQVQDSEKRYERYHVDLVNKLVEVIAKQDEGLSVQKRRAEVGEIIRSFGSSIAAQKEG